MKTPWHWEECEKLHGAAMTAFLRSVYETQISEEDFVVRYKPKGPPLGSSPWNKGTGNQTINRAVRACRRMLTWRTRVQRQFKGKCAKCGSRQGLHVHHIYQLHRILAEERISTLRQAEKCPRLWDITNGVLLCRSCHWQEHRKPAPTGAA
jgi:hypothetical protein